MLEFLKNSKLFTKNSKNLKTTNIFYHRNNMNLICYLLYGNDNKYYNMLLSSINTLIKNGNYKDDILFFVDDKNVDKLLKLDIPNNKYVINIKNIKSTGLNIFRIYEFDFINKYNKVLLIDIDTLISQDINNIFNIITKDNIFYFSSENRIYEPCSALSIAKQNEKNFYKQKGFLLNCGIISFKINKTNLLTCEHIYNTGKNIHTSCAEQPFINHFFLRKGNYSTILNNVIYNNFDKLYKNKNEYTIIHFLGGVDIDYFYKYSILLLNNFTRNDLSKLIFQKKLNIDDFNIFYDKKTNNIHIKHKQNFDTVDITIINSDNKLFKFNKCYIDNVVYRYFSPPFNTTKNFKVILSNDINEVTKKLTNESSFIINKN